MEPTDSRKLPRMDLLLSNPILTASGLPYAVLRRAAQEELECLRTRTSPLPDNTVILQGILRRALDSLTPTLTRAVNATGQILHTGLGRAPLASQAAAAMMDAAGYCTLEINMDTGNEGRRGGAVEALVADLTGAEAAAVVNNNTAALLLCLTALAFGKGVAVSRGELVEIDGSFRMSDIMEESGCVPVEVGATNRTRQSDYRTALESGRVQFLLKVHTSNYQMIGYTQDTSVSELVGLGRAYGFPVLYDLGSGLLLPARKLGVPANLPSVSEAVHSGADLVCFSGDKLLGGPQAGILAGRAWAIDAVKKHPLCRAFYPDKGVLAALEATLRLYRDPEMARKNIPVLSMLSASLSELAPRADALARMLKRLCGSKCLVEREERGEESDSLFSGAALDSCLVTLKPKKIPSTALATALRLADTPVIARLRGDKVVLDVRTLQEGDEPLIARALTAALH